MSGRYNRSFWWISTTVLMILVLSSCVFERRLVNDIEFMTRNKWEKRIDIAMNNDIMTVRIDGLTGYRLSQPVRLSLGLSVQSRDQIERIQIYPERIQCFFSGLPMVIDEIYANDTTGTGPHCGVYFHCNLPQTMWTDSSLIRNSIMITLDGVIEYEGKPIAIDTVYARMTHFDSMLKKRID